MKLALRRERVVCDGGRKGVDFAPCCLLLAGHFDVMLGLQARRPALLQPSGQGSGPDTKEQADAQPLPPHPPLPQHGGHLQRLSATPLQPGTGAPQCLSPASHQPGLSAACVVVIATTLISVDVIRGYSSLAFLSACCHWSGCGG